MKTKLLILTTILTLLGTSTIFALPRNANIRRSNSIYSNTERNYNRLNRQPQGLGIGGQMLQDGSCYLVN